MGFPRKNELEAAIAQLLPELIALRHELHRHPEIRFEEIWTSDRIATYLEDAGIEVKRGYARGTGIVATIKGHGDKTIALRSDMDALELPEQTGLAYASTIPNRMHACGHDGHMAMLCGAAKILAGHADGLNGNVRLIFQPAEELGAGARCMVAEGALDGVDAVFGFHGWPAIPVGKVGVKAGPAMAGADWFKIVIQGRGCHGADPSAGVDPIVVAAHITTALQTIVSRELDPREPAVVTVARIQGGVATNIIPETAELEGTFRTFSDDVRNKIAHAIERIAKSTAEAFRATTTIDVGDGTYVPLINDPAMTEFAKQAIAASLGPDAVVEEERPSMAAEDFAFYLRQVPGAFLWLGTGPKSGKAPSLHSPYFDFNDDALAAGVKVWVGLAREFVAYL